MICVKESEIGTLVKERLREFDACFVMVDNSDEAVDAVIKAVETEFGESINRMTADTEVFYDGEAARSALISCLNLQLKGGLQRTKPVIFAAVGTFDYMFAPEMPEEYINLSKEAEEYYKLERYYSNTKRSVGDIRGKITCPHCSSNFRASEVQLTLECPECGADLSEGDIDHASIRKYHAAYSKACNAKKKLFRKYKDEGRIPKRRLIAFGLRRDVDMDVLTTCHA